MKVLITGTSSGLGYELAKQFKAKGDTVYGTSRRKTKLNIKHLQCDFNNLEELDVSFQEFIKDVKEFDVVILNAGMLGEINKVSNLSLKQFNEIFNVNVLANKIILDKLLINKTKIQQVIGISSGAALKPYHGWSLYCTSKSAFKQLLSTYSYEYPDTSFISLAPGIIKTNMQDYINSLDKNAFPSVEKFQQMFDNMDTADIVAKKLINNLDKLKEGYIDLRNIDNL
tara:strand:+ start:565 stop:1245 length:681 start_codon:yes stop_codon:yes gene_type:complete